MKLSLIGITKKKKDKQYIVSILTIYKLISIFFFNFFKIYKQFKRKEKLDRISWIKFKSNFLSFPSIRSGSTSLVRELSSGRN